MATLRDNKDFIMLTDEKKEKYLIRRLAELPPEKLEYVIRGLKERLTEKNREKLKAIVNDENYSVLSISEIKEILSEHKTYLRNHFYVKNIGLFGSYAKGRQTSYSDIDLVVQFFEGSKIGFKFITLKNFLEDLLGKPIDLMSFESLKDNVRRNIEKEVVYLWEEISEN
jgi:predicted nucleotidyltransferase